jgi:hypothetical protein
MSDEKDYSAAHEATIGRWRKAKENAEDNYENAVRSLKESLKNSLKDPNKKRGVATDLKEATKNKDNGRHREGYGDDDEIITGFEGRPWDD